MNQDQKYLLRMAIRLQQQYAAQRKRALLEAVGDTLAQLRTSIDLAVNHERMLRRAVKSGWNLCLPDKWAEYTWALQDIENKARAIHNRSSTLGFTPQRIPGSTALSNEYWLPPTLRDLYDELLLAEREFSEVEYDRTERRISVTTDRIELEGIDLGPFRIDLFLGEMRSDSTEQWFLVHATEPNAAASREDVTHPHVMDDKLCTGDGAIPIQQALLNGRIGEFFVLVRSVLETYNADSAYVPLERRSGQSCHDCGYLESSEMYFCEGCEHEFCDECMSCCEVCSISRCRGCLDKSEISEEYICKDCGTFCSDCGKFGSVDEITETVCEDCRQRQEMEDEEEIDNETTTPTKEHSHEPAPNQTASISGC